MQGGTRCAPFCHVYQGKSTYLCFSKKISSFLSLIKTGEEFLSLFPGRAPGPREACSTPALVTEPPTGHPGDYDSRRALRASPRRPLNAGECRDCWDT